MESDQEILFNERKRQLNRKIVELIESGARTQELVKILNAQKYLRLEQKGRQEPVTVFDIKSFVEDEARKLNTTLLPDSMTQIDGVILPPGQGEIVTGSGNGFEEREKISRCRYLVDVLTELNVHYSVISGKIDKKMARSGSYQVFLIPEKQKIVFVNDEADNATFVVHQVEDPEEWKGLSQMTKEELKGLAEGKRTSTVNWQANPQYWKNRIKGILSIDLPVEKPVDALRNNKDGQYEYAPDGWLTNFGLVRKNKQSGQGKIALLANHYRKKRPDWFKMCLAASGHVREYYHPDLVALIEKEMGAYEKAPPGWWTYKGLAKRTGRDPKTIKSLVEKSRTEHPDWFKLFKDAGGKILEHLHPDLAALFEKEKIIYEPVPRGWLTRNRLAARVGRYSPVIKSLLDKYRIGHPDWFKTYLDEFKRPNEHLHPDLVALVEKEMSAYEKVPSGWLTCGGLASVMAKSHDVIKRVAGRYRSERPEWFKVYLGDSGKVREHFHPDLVAQIKKELSML